ncbi:MAG: hypothetical protein FJZ85_02165 [Chloroflexi bacterium]|nr:hypothetical protein [Chloroflexota bacterium]
MATSLKSNIVVEERTLGFYAADAGIEDVVWKYKDGQDPFASGTSYTMAEQLNGMTVTIERLEEPEIGADGIVYTVKSTARLNGEIKGEIIAELVGGADFTWLFDAAITSAQDVTLKPGTVVVGDVVYGDDISNQGEVDGEIIQDTELQDKWPSAALLSAFYYNQVKDLTPYPSDEITLAGDQCNPTVIGPLYRNGNLTLKGSGWGRLDGLVYVTGTVTVNPTSGCDLDLNGQTIFSEYHGNCDAPGDSAIYIGPKAKLWGTGCVIAVGNVVFQPQLTGTGEKRIGLNCDAASGQAAKDTFLLSRFTADKDGKIDTFRINCSGKGKVKVALYADNVGFPDAMLGAVNDSISVDSGWNNVPFPETNLTAGTDYWLAANSDSAIIRYNTSGPSKTKSATYSSFTFPEYAGAGFTDELNKQYLFAGYGRPFIFVMSIECSSDIKPGGTFYGSIAGDAEVEMYPNTSLTWTQAPVGEGGLNFPGSGSVGGGSSDMVVRTYTIK